ncbi:MAG: hypothetical protein Q9225_003206 [Loekoesia sp. 1 TL-2023]
MQVDDGSAKEILFNDPRRSSSAMDVDLVNGTLEPSKSATISTRSSNTWRTLTAQALSTRNRSLRAGRTQAKQRKLFRERAKARKLDRLHQAGKSGKSEPARPKRKQKLQLAKLARREQIRVRKQNATSKAQQVARAKALERAISNLRLDSTDAKSTDQPPSRHLLLSFTHAAQIIERPDRAQKAYADLRKFQATPSYAEELRPDDQRRLLLLQKNEDLLQIKAREGESIEAALLYQDERVAYFSELRASRGKSFPTDDEPGNDLNDEHPLSSQPPLARSEAVDRSEPAAHLAPQHSRPPNHLTEKQKKKDVETAKDVEAYHQNPNIVLPRKRWKRLRSALSHGRTDLNAVSLEKKHAKAEKTAKELRELMEKRNLYRPQQIQPPLQNVEDRGTRPGGSGGDELKCYDSYRPAQESNQRRQRSISGGAGSPLKHGDFYRPDTYISDRTPRLSNANLNVSEDNDYRRPYDSYRPSQDSRGRVDSYRPAVGNTNAASKKY